MKMKRLMIIVSVFACLFYSCEEDNPNDLNNDPGYFPNSVGSYWVYERYDSLAEKLDTVTVSITGDTLHYGKNYKIWEYVYSFGIDTLFVIQNNDTVIFYMPWVDWIYQVYILPFETGNTWANPDFFEDSSFVSDKQDITIDGIKYHDVYIIDRKASGPNENLTEKIWIKPKAGLLKLERIHFSLGPYKNETWKLIEKSIQ